MLLPSFLSGVSVLTKSKPFSYLHNSGSTSDLGFLLSDLPELQCVIVEVSSDIKQFVVTNCSKERPGSIVTETLKNGIFQYRDININFSIDAISISHQKNRILMLILNI